MNKQVSVEQYVDNFLNSIGIKQPMKFDIFWKKSRTKFGKLSDELLDAIDMRGHGQNIDIYPIKNKNLDFANTVASQYDSPRLRKFLAWVIYEQFEFKEKITLDLGCDNGIFLCFLAQLNPESEFIGIDNCQEAIEIANIRAENLGLNNCRFIHSDLFDIKNKIQINSIDFIFSSLVFHEIIKIEKDGKTIDLYEEDSIGFSLSENDSVTNDTRSMQIIANISVILKNNAHFISLDRWGRAHQLQYWIRLCESKNLSLSFTRSNKIKFRDHDGDYEEMPISVFIKNDGVADAKRSADIHALYTFPEFIQSSLSKQIDNHDIAEIIYNGLSKEKIYTVEIKYFDKSGVQLIEIGAAQGVGYIYATTSKGFRNLQLLPSITLYEPVKKIESELNEMKKAGDLTIELHNSFLAKTLEIDCLGN